MKMYKKGLIASFLIIILFITCVKTASADGMVVPYPNPDESATLEFPIVKYHHVNITIDSHHSKTHVDQEFFNPYDYVMTGKYIFPIPQGAVISNFKITVDGKEKEAKIMDSQEAQEIFQQSVLNMQTAAILQYSNNDLLSCEVSIPANSSIKMTLEYDEILSLKNGLYKYKYILSTEQFSAANIENVSINIDITNDKNIDMVYSPTHIIKSNQISEKHVTISYSEHNSRPDEDFELYFSCTNEDFGASLITFDKDDEKFFMLFFQSSIQNPETTDYLPKDIVFVLDDSGSMSWDDKIIQAKDALKWILNKLSSQDRFNIVNFDSSVRCFSNNLENADETKVTEAIDYVDSIKANGGTNINDALLKACDLFKTLEETSRPRIIFFLTDGQATVGTTDTESILSNVNNANIEGGVDASIYVFGVGYDVNTHLLDQLANNNHGERVYVDPDESIESKLIELYSKIQNPLLTQISIDVSGKIETYDIYPKTISNLYAGSEIVLVGKYTLSDSDEEDVKVKVQAMKGENIIELNYNFSLESDDTKSFIPRIWATRRIGELMDTIKIEGETDELVEEVKELGTKYGIVTPYTSFLIEEQQEGITYGMSENLEDADGDGLSDALAPTGRASNKQSTANQLYLDSFHVSSTSGANIQQKGSKLFAALDDIQIDLKIIGNQSSINLDGKTAHQWINDTFDITNYIEFGSDDYFELLKNSDLIDTLSAGQQVVFEYDNETYFITNNATASSSITPITPITTQTDNKENSTPGFDFAIILISLGVAMIVLKKLQKN